MSIYLVWERRAELGQLRPAPHWFGLLATLGFGGLWLVAGLGNVLVVQQICVIGLLNAVAFAIYGPRVYVVLAFPLLTIFLVTPMWNVLENPLRDLSTVVTHVVLEMLSMPVLLEGYEVGGRFVGLFRARIFPLQRVDRRLFRLLQSPRTPADGGFIVLGLALSIVANWIRILAIITVGNATQMDHWIVDDHLFFGWLLFSGMLIPYFWAGNVLLNRWQPAFEA